MGNTTSSTGLGMKTPSLPTIVTAAVGILTAVASLFPVGSHWGHLLLIVAAFLGNLGTILSHISLNNTKSAASNPTDAKPQG